MASVSQSFYCLWQEERIRETLFEILPKEDICNVRLSNSACCNLVTKRLFMRTHLTFTANTFTKACRVQALSRIGHHIEHLTFYMPHSDATFLPPLIHPLTGREISFLYTPHTCMMSVLTRPKYANTELGEVLTQQYPPLFHAATNVPSFLNAIKNMPNIRHLTIKCPGQDPKERYRRDVVDYALISLRISIERAPLHKLSKLSLSAVHPAAFNYLRHVPGFGSNPSAARRWRQIRKLYMSVDTWDFHGPSPGLDHLKIIDDFIRNMAPQLEKFSFSWIDDKRVGIPKGPCPIALSGDSLFSPRPEGPRKLFNEVTGPMSPLPPAPRREPMHMPRLRCLTLRNATMNTPQLRDLVERHRQTVREFDFENVSLTDGGTYEDAFSQLLAETSGSGNNLWSRSRASEIKSKSKRCKCSGDSGTGQQQCGNAALDMSPNASPTSHQSFRFAADPLNESLLSDSSTVVSGPAAVASPDDIELSFPSAAVAAVSRELLDLGVEDFETYLGLGSELPFMLDSPSCASASSEVYPHVRMPPPPTIEEVNEDVLHYREDKGDDCDDYDDGGLSSDIAAAHDASLTFSTHFKKRRVRRSHKRHHSAGDVDKPEADERHSRSRRHRHNHHHRHHSDHQDDNSRSGRSECGEKSERGEKGEMSGRKHGKTSRSRPRSTSPSSHRRHRDGQKGSSSASSGPIAHTPPPSSPTALPSSAERDRPFANRTPPPQPPQPRPAIVGQYTSTSKDADDFFMPRVRAESSDSLSLKVAPLNISAPILAVDSAPIVLQPTVYDPSATSAAPVTASPTVLGLSRSQSSSSAVSASSAVYHSASDDGLSTVQRQILQEQEQAQKQRRLRMAEDPEARTSALKKAREAVLTKLSREFNKRIGREAVQASVAASAATMAAAAASVSMSLGAQPGSQSYRWDSCNSNNDNGYSAHSNAASATLSLLAGLRLRGRLFGDSFAAVPMSSNAMVPAVPMDYYQHHSMESNSAVVPLIFSGA